MSPTPLERLIGPIDHDHPEKGHIYEITYAVEDTDVDKTDHVGNSTEMLRLAVAFFQSDLLKAREEVAPGSFTVDSRLDPMRHCTNIRVIFQGRPEGFHEPGRDDSDQDDGMWPLGRPEGVEPDDLEGRAPEGGSPRPKPLQGVPGRPEGFTRDEMMEALQEAVKFLLPYSDVRKAAQAALQVLQGMTPLEFSIVNTRRESLGEDEDQLPDLSAY